jgi:hypothetical protein
MPRTKLSTPQRNMLLRCRAAVGGAILMTKTIRRTALSLERLGMVDVNGFDPPTWAHAPQPRSHVIRINRNGLDWLESGAS